MLTVVINDQPMEAQAGERLLAVARRNAAHIGFVCDGRGMCQTCQSRILEGGEHVSPPNDVERSWLTDAQIDQGVRLACQTALLGTGPVKMISGAEEVRRKLLAVFSPPYGTNPGENLGAFLNQLGNQTINHVSRFPFNVVNTSGRIFQMPPNLRGIQQYAGDVGNVLQRMTGSQRTLTEPQRVVVETETT